MAQDNGGLLTNPTGTLGEINHTYRDLRTYIPDAESIEQARGKRR